MKPSLTLTLLTHTESIHSLKSELKPILEIQV